MHSLQNNESGILIFAFVKEIWLQNHHFKNMKRNLHSLSNDKFFSFHEVYNDDVLHKLEAISPDSSPGISNIPTKVILGARNKLIPALTVLFNQCLTSLRSIPNEWK